MIADAPTLIPTPPAAGDGGRRGTSPGPRPPPRSGRLVVRLAGVVPDVPVRRASQHHAAQLAEQDAQAEVEGKRAKALGQMAKAERDMQEARKTALDNGFTEAELSALVGGLSSLALGPGYPMGTDGPAPFS